MPELPRENNKVLGAHLGHQEVERVVMGIDDIFEVITLTDISQELDASKSCLLIVIHASSNCPLYL